MTKPPAGMVATCALLAIASMIAALYFAGNGQTPLAMAGTAVFVLLGGVTFELARRRSV